MPIRARARPRARAAIRAGRHRAVVLAREVDVVAEQRLDLDQRLPELRQPAREAALELVERGSGLRRRGGVDQVAHRLRLHQVELAVEHGAAGELAGRGRPGARRVERREQPRRGQQAAVAGELHQVLAGVAAGCGKDGVEAAVDRLAAASRKVASSAARGRSLPEPSDDPRRHRERAAPAQPDEGQRGAAGRRGQRGDGVGEQTWYVSGEGHGASSRRD